MPWPRHDHDAGSTAPWLVLTVLLLVPVVALSGWWVVTRGENPARSAGQVEPVQVPVTRQDVRAQASVTIALGEAPGREVVALGSGTVTVAVPVGINLDNGVVALRLDDRPIRVMVACADRRRPGR